MWPTIRALLVLHGRRVSDLPGQRLLWERPLDAPLCSLQPSHVLRQNYSRFLYVRRVIFCSISPRCSTLPASCVSSPHTDNYAQWHLHASWRMHGHQHATPHKTTLNCLPCVAFISAHFFKNFENIVFYLANGFCRAPEDQEAFRQILISGNTNASAREETSLPAALWFGRPVCFMMDCTKLHRWIHESN